jgi:hypothetical protein
MEEATDITSPKTMSLTSTLDVNAVDLQLEDGSLIKVSKPVLMRIPYFKKFFSKTLEQPLYKLSGVDVYATQVLLKILHHKPYSCLPWSMSSEQLFYLAAVCDKYGTTEIVSAYVELRNWKELLWKEDKPLEGSWTAWLWILYMFRGRRSHWIARYKMVLDVLAANMSLKDGNWTFGPEDRPIKIADIECPSTLNALQGKS